MPGMRGRLAPGLVLAFCAALAVLAVQRPLHNWDMIGYVAAARSYTTPEPERIRTEVYDLLARSVPAERYDVLTRGEVRHARATDPESLGQFLPLYRIRVAYVATVLGLWELGVNPFLATRLVSAVCAALAIVVLALLFPVPRHPAAVLLIPPIALASGFWLLSRYSTPDAWAALAACVCYALTLRGRGLVLFALPLSLLVRTDMLLLALCFLVYFWIGRRFDRRWILASAAITTALFLGIHRYFDYYGWRTLFTLDFLEYTAYPARLEPLVTPESYWTVLRSRSGDLLQWPFAFLAGAVLTGLFGVLRLSGGSLRRLSTTETDAGFVLVSSLVYAVIHFLVFPDPSTRFYAGQIALAGTSALWLLGRTRRGGASGGSHPPSGTASGIS